MDEQEIFTRVVTTVEKLLKTVNRDIKTKIKKDTNIYSDLGIDSVEVMDLLGLIESEFKINIDVEKAEGKQTVGDITKLVASSL